MSDSKSARNRSTDEVREAGRLARSIAIALGQAVRAGRRSCQLTQRALGDRVGVQQAWISRIELGHGERAPLHLWVALGVALGRPLAVSLSKPLGDGREPVDSGHLAMQERLLALAHANGRRAMFELPTRPLEPRRSIDVCVRDDRHRVLVIQEAWNTFGDVGAAVRSTNRKVAEAADLAATITGGMPYRVASVWVVRPSATNRILLRRYSHVFRSAFPGSSRNWLAALATGTVPPSQPGLVWLEPGSGRLTAWHRVGDTNPGRPYRTSTRDRIDRGGAGIGGR